MNSILGEGTKEHWVRSPNEQGSPCGWSRKRRGRCVVGLRGEREPGGQSSYKRTVPLSEKGSRWSFEQRNDMVLVMS